MPLKPGSSRETISENIKETLESSTFAPGKSRQKRQQMAIAAAHRSARKRKGKRPRTISRAAMTK